MNLKFDNKFFINQSIEFYDACEKLFELQIKIEFIQSLLKEMDLKNILSILFREEKELSSCRNKLLEKLARFKKELFAESYICLNCEGNIKPGKENAAGFCNACFKESNVRGDSLTY